MTTEAFAPAKINLSLHVTGQRSDGYHLLDSLVVFADVGDRLWFEPSTDLSLEVSGPFSEGVPTDSRNIVWRAATLSGFVGRIHLEKNIPHGAGLGGGSADAAALLREMEYNDLDGVLSLGADVPVCMKEVPQRMRGIGERLDPVPSCAACNIVLINPGTSVPTATVFQGLASKTNPDMEMCSMFENVDALVAGLRRYRNDLETPARRVAPIIGTCLSVMDDAMIARMSGSGATCFGIYPTAETAQAAAARIAAAYPAWWVTAARTYPSRAK